MKPIFVSLADHQRLTRMINDFIRSSRKLPDPIRRLRRELQRAAVVERDFLPNGVVSLNSRVTLLDVESGEREEWVLTLPEYSDFDRKRLSVLAPVGTAILGYAEGDSIEWETPGGPREFRIEKVEENSELRPGLPKSIYG